MLIGMPGRDDRDAMRQFVAKYGLDFPQAVDDDGSLWAHLRVPDQPAWIFVSPSGNVSKVFGELTVGQLSARFDGLLA